MFSSVLKCFLAVLFTCTFFVSSGARATNNAGSSGAFSSASASAYAGTVTSIDTDVSVLSGASAFTGTGQFLDTHERHKGIRSYGNTNFPQDNDANRGVKSLGHHHRSKSDSQNYNKDGDDCSKCKWENDDYWERDEPEEEGDENNRDECEDGDDGQYKPDKTHHHGGSISREHASELHLSGVHKTGPTGIYNDNVKEGIKGVKPDGLFGVTNFPGNIRYAGLTNSYGSTTKPGPIWNTPFASTSKPGYSDVTVNNFMTTPSYGLGTDWNKKTTLVSYGFTPKPAGSNRHGDTFAGNFGTTPTSTWNSRLGSNPTIATFLSSQKPGLSWNVNHDNTPARSYESTPKPGTSWNIGIGAPTGGFTSSQKSGTSWNNGHDDISIGSYGTTPRSGQGWNTRLPDIPTTRSPFIEKPTSNWNPDHGNIPAESFGTSKPGLSGHISPGAPTAEFPSSQKPVSSWNVGHYNIPARNFETTSKPGLSWNTGSGAPTAGFFPLQKPVIPWSIGRDGTPIGSSVSTVNLGQNQNTGFDVKSGSSWISDQGTMLVNTSGCTRPDTSCSQRNHGPVKVGATPFDSILTKNDKSPSSISPTTSHGRSDTIPSDSLKNSNGNQNRLYGQYGATSTSGAHAEASVTSNFGSIPHDRISVQPQASYNNNGAHATAGATFSFGSTPYSAAPDFRQKGHPFWPTSTLTPYSTRRYDELSQVHSNTGSNIYRPGAHGDIFSPGNLSESSTKDSIHGHSGALKPSYGTETTTTTSLSSAGTGSNVWPASIPLIHAGSTSYSSVKSSFGNTRPTYGTGSLDTQHDGRIVTRPDNQSGDRNEPWFSKQPESNITPGGHSRSGVASETWPGRQVGHESRLRCSSGSCGGSTGPSSGSNNCEGNFNCGSGCTGRRNNVPTIYGPCDGVINGPSGVNKTYYPAGTGDGNVPNIANTYEPGSFSNTGDRAYPGVNIECGKEDNSCNQGSTDVTVEGPVQWNPANPFLYGPIGSIPYDAPYTISRTISKPIDKGNPFLDSSWNNPKAGDNNVNNYRNVIHLGQENTKLFNKENPFLTDNKRRGDIEINTDEQVIPFGGRKPDRSNVFGVPFDSGSSDSSSSSYDKHSAESSGSRLPGNSDYRNIKSGLHPGRVSPQGGDSDISSTGGDSQSIRPLQCQFGLFGCGTPGSGSYAATKDNKHPEGNIGINIGNLGSVNSDLREFGSARTGIASASGNNRGGFGTGADHSESAGNNLAGSIRGAYAGAYAGSSSSAQASSSNFANAKSLSFSGTGHGNNFDQANSGSWPSSGAQNQDESNSWVSNGASAFASSSATSWSGNHPVDVKG